VFAVRNEQSERRCDAEDLGFSASVSAAERDPMFYQGCMLKVSEKLSTVGAHLEGRQRPDALARSGLWAGGLVYSPAEQTG
jgi:hypothetical protein